MLLARIKGSISKFANTISKTLDVDVLIVDSNLKVIGSTFRYFDQYDIIRRMSIVGQCISTGGAMAIEDRRKSETCRTCPEYEACEMRGLIAVPISHKGAVIGAISLIIPQQKVAAIFRDVRNSVEFLQNMSELLSGKLQDSDDYSALEVIKQEREILMDEVECAIVATDNLGVISYHNRQFLACFGEAVSYVGRALYEVVPHKAIRDFLTRQTYAENLPIFIEAGGEPFYGLLSCKNITIKGQYTGALFLFRPLGQGSVSLLELSAFSERVSFEDCGERLFPGAVVGEAKRLAVSDRSILIAAAPHTGETILARCIHNYSDRGLTSLSVVDCGSVRDLREEAIFGELGHLHLAHKGTVLFRDVERLPLYLQEKLLRFLQERAIQCKDGIRVRVDVRLLFSTNANLKEMAEDGNFLEQLYYRLSEHVLRLPPIAAEPTRLRRAIEEGIRFYKGQYHKGELSVLPEVITRLCYYDWPDNLLQLDQTLDRLVAHAEGEIALADLQRLPAFSHRAIPSIEALERERIGQLLRRRCTKGEIADTLGISRATLYRKIKQYGLTE